MVEGRKRVFKTLCKLIKFRFPMLCRKRYLCCQRTDGEKSDLPEIDENRKEKFVHALMPLMRRKWEPIRFPYWLHNFENRWSDQLWNNCDHATKMKNWRISGGHDRIVELIKRMSQNESLLFALKEAKHLSGLAESKLGSGRYWVIAFDVLVLCDVRNLFSRLNVGNLDWFQKDGWVSKTTQVQDSNIVQAKVSLCCQHLSTYGWWKSSLLEIGENRKKCWVNSAGISLAAGATNCCWLSSITRSTVSTNAQTSKCSNSVNTSTSKALISILSDSSHALIEVPPFSLSSF